MFIMFILQTLLDDICEFLVENLPENVTFRKPDVCELCYLLFIQK